MAATRNGLASSPETSPDGHLQVNGFHDTPGTSTSTPRPNNGIIPTILSTAQRALDRIVSPEARELLFTSVSHFTHAHPTLSSFIAAQLFFSALPILAFLSFALAAFTLSLITALITALCVTGLALLFLIPTLLLTTSLAVIAWAWLAGSFFVLRAVYRFAQDVSQQPAEDEDEKSTNGTVVEIKSETATD